MIDLIVPSRLLTHILRISSIAIVCSFIAITGFGQAPSKTTIANTTWPDSVYIDLSKTQLSKLEKDIVNELNKLRSNPPKYANEVLKPMLSYFDGFLMRIPEEDLPLFTNEGIAAVEECIEVLLRTEPLPLLKFDMGLYGCASKHANDIGLKGLTGHNGSDGSTSTNRIKAACSTYTKAGENIDFGFSNAKDIITSLLIDDGVPTRGHRRNFLDPKYRVVGIKVSRHELYDWVTVFDFADTCK